MRKIHLLKSRQYGHQTACGIVDLRRVKTISRATEVAFRMLSEHQASAGAMPAALRMSPDVHQAFAIVFPNATQFCGVTVELDTELLGDSMAIRP